MIYGFICVPHSSPHGLPPDSVLLQILSLLDDSADVACCRVASKAFDTVFPGLRSINLEWPFNSRSRVSKPQRIKHFKRVFLGLISKLESVESVCLHIRRPVAHHLSLTDGDFAKEWLPRVSGSLKSLSITECPRDCGSNVLPLISEYCHNLVSLKLRFVYLRLDNLNPMPMLTKFPITKTMEELTLDTGNKMPRDPTDLKLTLGKVFTVFPNMAYLCICSGVWSDLEACLNPQGWEILDGRKELETICAYLELADPSLTFSCVARVLDQCVGLLEVSLLIHADVEDTHLRSALVMRISNN
ncbi:hypothetical protein L1987_09569 [Smallanthus sonchifolius]|uniref:Uncharacterized protein n=1 Tax=Smallanthus sonchifolius TaxID=185202 RepID=A0ACB9JPR6_9ASTR|nr:hypothetical protein L1987_09569 [Smallanthus sonchifolius]